MNKKLKKILLPLVLFASISCATSCQPSVFTGKVKIDYGDYQSNLISTKEQLTYTYYEELSSKVNSKESMVVLIYSSGCSCWGTFAKDCVIPYYNNTHVRMYCIDCTQFDGASDKFGLYTYASDMPSVAIFNRGTLVYQSVYGRNGHDIFTNPQKFEEFMETYIILPRMMFIKKDDLTSLFASTTTFNLYVTKTGCPDCGAIEPVLRNYFDNNTTSSFFYVFDIKPYQSQPNYQEIKDWLGLSSSGNPTLGWDEGMVPTFQNRTGSTINDMITVYNDSCSSNTIISFFTAERANYIECLKNQTEVLPVLNGMTVENYNVDEFRKKYHDPIVTLFLNKYMK